MSNETKAKFKAFKEKYGLKGVGMKHAVYYDDKKWLYQVPDSNGHIECRQFYEGFDGFIFENKKGLNTVAVKDIDITNIVTRISPSMEKAYQAYYSPVTA